MRIMAFWWGVPVKGRNKSERENMTIFAIYIAALIFIEIPVIIFFGYPPTWFGVLQLIPMIIVIVKNIKELNR